MKQKRLSFRVFDGVGLPRAKRKRGFSVRRGYTPGSQTGAQVRQGLRFMHEYYWLGNIVVLPVKLSIGGQTQGK